MVKFLSDVPGTEATFTKGSEEETVTVTYVPGKSLVIKVSTLRDDLIESVREAGQRCNSSVSSGVPTNFPLLLPISSLISFYTVIPQGDLQRVLQMQS